MTSDFHTSELLKSASNYPIAKGGLGSGAQLGHEFNGNQYVSAGNQAAESQKLNDYVKDNGGRWRIDHFAVSEQHRNIARALEETAKQLEGEKGHIRLRDAYAKAGAAHREAAGLHAAAFVNPLTGSLSAPGAAAATQKAHDASLKADELNYAN